VGSACCAWAWLRIDWQVSCTVDLMTRLGLPHQLDVPITPSRHCCRVVAVGIDTRFVKTREKESWGSCLRLLPCPRAGCGISAQRQATAHSGVGATAAALVAGCTALVCAGTCARET
jgi:hypothetical protein